MIEKYTQTDSRGRTYPVWLCEVGHWHRGLRQAQLCKAAKARRAEKRADAIRKSDGSLWLGTFGNADTRKPNTTKGHAR